MPDRWTPERLFGLATGADRVSIADVLRQLQQQRSSLVNGDHGASVSQLLNRAEALAQDQRRSSETLEQWLTLRDEYRQIEAATLNLLGDGFLIRAKTVELVDSERSLPTLAFLL